MVYRFGKNGRFLSCSGYPECKFAAPCDREGRLIEEKESEHKCPTCGKPMVVKRGRFGEFLGCSDYPECKTVLKLDKQGHVLPPKPPAEPTGIRCHKCKEGHFVIRQSKRGPFLGCDRFPRCRTIVSIQQLDTLRRLQEEGRWPPSTIDEADALLGRTKDNKASGDKAGKAAGKKGAKKKTRKKAKRTAKKTSPASERDSDAS